MRNFDILIEQLKTLLEAEAPVEEPTTDQEMPPTEGESQPTQPVAKPPTSESFAMLTQIILDAFKTPQLKFHGDIKYSNNLARNSQEAFKYLEIIKRNISEDVQHHFEKNFGQGSDETVDSNEIVAMVNLALKALFHPNKEETQEEFTSIADIDTVDVNNAKEVYNTIRNIVGIDTLQ